MPNICSASKTKSVTFQWKYDGDVRTPWGESPQLPRDVLAGVMRKARQFGRRVAGDDLFLLALSELPGDSPASRALQAERADAARLQSGIRTTGDGQSTVDADLTFSPATYQMHGRAQGFAATLGDGTITPEHVLLALLWDPMSASCQLLWRLGVRRERVVERLHGLGVAVPNAPLPPQREVTLGEQARFPRADVRAVVDHLRLNIPPGTAWGFNYEGDDAWAVADITVDLRRLVDEAITH